LIAGSLTSLGTAAEARGDYEAARTHLGTAVNLFRDSGDYQSLAITLNNLGYLALCSGDYGSARDLCDEALELNRERSDYRGMTAALLNLGIAAIHQRQDTRAVELFEESLGHAEQLEHSAYAAFALEGLAAAAARKGNATVAAELLGAAKSLLEAAGVVLDPVERALHDATLTTARSTVGDDDLAAALARGAALTFDQAIKLGHAVNAKGRS
jgi:tetratricopeptide (TPR) repeat protein